MKPYIWLLVAAVSLSSCLTSVNPLVSHNNISRFDACVGQWRGEDVSVNISRYRGSEVDKLMRKILEKETKPGDTNEVKWQDNSYTVDFTVNNIRHFMILQFTAIRGRTFAQLSPIGAVKMKNPRDMHRPVYEIPDSLYHELWEGKKETFSFARVESSGSQLKLTFVNGDYIHDLVTKGTMALKYESDALFGTRYITASTSELEAFFSKYGGDDRLFDKANALVLNRVNL
ncbi:MAG TPA: hypothetical protein VFZ78_05890 [Flavisolibacter sp.]